MSGHMSKTGIYRIGVILLVIIGVVFGWAIFGQSSPAYAAEDGTKATAKPAKPTLKSVKSTKAKKMTVTWKTVEGAEGYDIWYKTGDTAKTFTVEVKKSGSDDDSDVKKTRSATLKNLWGGEEYKVKVRSFKMSGTSSNKTKVKSGWSKAKTVTVAHNRWSDLQDKYIVKSKVKQLIFVKCTGGSNATLLLYKKKDADDDDDSDEKIWERVLTCDAYIGQNGLGKKKEGDRKTPEGCFTITHAFGVKKDPGSKMDYLKLKDYHYWCGDEAHYNQLIDIRDYPHSCRGEHLINYTKQYAYSMALNYNKKCVYGKGSAIFLHCFGYNPYTLGCIAVSEDNMKTILKTCADNTKICIYKK